MAALAGILSEAMRGKPGLPRNEREYIEVYLF